jgi:hypothetical protein
MASVVLFVIVCCAFAAAGTKTLDFVSCQKSPRCLLGGGVWAIHPLNTHKVEGYGMP